MGCGCEKDKHLVEAHLEKVRLRRQAAKQARQTQQVIQSMIDPLIVEPPYTKEQRDAIAAKRRLGLLGV